MLFAVIEEAAQKPSPFAMTFMLTEACLALLGFYVFSRLVRRISLRGPQVRHDLFALPETVAGLAVLVYISLFFILARHFPAGLEAPLPPSIKGHELQYVETPVPPTQKEGLLLAMAAAALLPAPIVVALLFRGARLGDVFGLGKLRLGQTVGMGLGLGILAAAVSNTVSLLLLPYVQQEPQQLIQRFQSAASGGNLEIMSLIGFSALLVAPIAEELAFRGAFYPIVARGLGRVPAAVICALLFGLAHDTLSGVAPLAVLALLLTLAYEATGSLVVPIIMHMVFNSQSLFLLWWATTHGQL